MKPDREKEEKAISRRNRRMLVVGCVFTLFFLVIAFKAIYLQVFEDTRLSREASGEYSRSVKLREKRGTIYDANSRELAVSTSVMAVGAHPDRINQPARAAAVMAEELNLDKSGLTEKLRSDASFVWIRRDVSPEKARGLDRRIDQGLELVDTYSRVYPHKSLGAQVIGFSGVDGHGLEGVEYYYDTRLKGDPRQWTIVKDALGRIFQRSSPEQASEEGKNLVLTLDANIQYITEEALKKSVLRFNAESGMALVMEPQTGAIRAVAHYPGFNPNAFTRFPRQNWRNRAITDSFEPGSTFKIFLAAAALESGLYTPDTIVDCENGRYSSYGRVIQDTHPYDELTLTEVIKYSSNIGAVKIAEAIGPKTFYDTLRDFGFGEKTGIDCPGETAGRLRHYRNWRGIDNATIAFGQGVSVSAVQLLSAVSAIANHGVLMKPRVAKAVTNPGGGIVESFEPERVRRVISGDVAAQLKEMMQAVTESGGTGELASPEGYKVCGKTGTAQILNDQGTYKNSEYNALFAGFAPAESPELAALVVVRAPKVNHYGGKVAGSAFAEIIRESFNYMNIAPTVARNSGNRSDEKEGA